MKARVEGVAPNPVFELLIDPHTRTCPRPPVWSWKSSLEPIIEHQFWECRNYIFGWYPQFFSEFFLTLVLKQTKVPNWFQKNLPGPTRQAGHVSLRGSPLHCTGLHSFVVYSICIYICICICITERQPFALYCAVIFCNVQKCNIVVKAAVQCKVHWWGVSMYLYLYLYLYL